MPHFLQSLLQTNEALPSYPSPLLLSLSICKLVSVSPMEKFVLLLYVNFPIKYICMCNCNMYFIYVCVLYIYRYSCTYVVLFKHSILRDLSTLYNVVIVHFTLKKMWVLILLVSKSVQILSSTIWTYWVNLTECTILWPRNSIFICNLEKPSHMCKKVYIRFFLAVILMMKMWKLSKCS